MNRKWMYYTFLSVVICTGSILTYNKWFSWRISDDLLTFGKANLLDVSDPTYSSEIDSSKPLLSRPSGSRTSEWLKWQVDLRQFLSEDVYELEVESFTGAMNSVNTSGVSEKDGITRVEMWIPTVGRHNVPAVLLLPNSEKISPAILLIPGHVKDGVSGLKQMTQDVSSYHNSAALKLALAGFVTLTIELRGFGLLGPPNFPNHQVIAYNSLLAGDFYKKLAIHDVAHAFEYLLAHPLVDSSRIGISGVSLGGEIAVAYAGIDERVAAIAFHSYGGVVGSFDGIRSGNATVPHYCHIIPASNSIFRQEDAFLLLAPRPTFGARGIEQPFRNKEFEVSLERTWVALGVKQKLTLLNLPGQAEFGGHAFFVDETIRFFNDSL